MANKELELLQDLLNAYPVTSYCKLQCVNQQKNQYKYYIIMVNPNQDNSYSLVVNYGRINSSKMEKVYLEKSTESVCKKQAEKLYNEKVKKGYVVVEKNQKAVELKLGI